MKYTSNIGYIDLHFFTTYLFPTKGGRESSYGDVRATKKAPALAPSYTPSHPIPNVSDLSQQHSLPFIHSSSYQHLPHTIHSPSLGPPFPPMTLHTRLTIFYTWPYHSNVLRSVRFTQLNSQPYFYFITKFLTLSLLRLPRTHLKHITPKPHIFIFCCRFNARVLK